MWIFVSEFVLWMAVAVNLYLMRWWRRWAKREAARSLSDINRVLEALSRVRGYVDHPNGVQQPVDVCFRTLTHEPGAVSLVMLEPETDNPLPLPPGATLQFGVSPH